MTSLKITSVSGAYLLKYHYYDTMADLGGFDGFVRTPFFASNSIWKPGKWRLRRSRFWNFPWGACHQTPLASHTFGAQNFEPSLAKSWIRPRWYCIKWVQIKCCFWHSVRFGKGKEYFLKQASLWGFHWIMIVNYLHPGSRGGTSANASWKRWTQVITCFFRGRVQQSYTWSKGQWQSYWS